MTNNPQTPLTALTSAVRMALGTLDKQPAQSRAYQAYKYLFEREHPSRPSYMFPGDWEKLSLNLKKQISLDNKIKVHRRETSARRMGKSWLSHARTEMVMTGGGIGHLTPGAL